MRLSHLFFSLFIVSVFIIGKPQNGGIISPKPEETHTVMPKGMTLKKVIDKYYEVRGGKKSVLAVKDLMYVMSAKYDGMPIVDTVWQKQPHLYNSSIYYYTVGKTTIYNAKSEVRDLYGVRELKDAELDELVLQSHMNPLLNLDKLGIKAKLEGLKKFQGNDCYVVKLTFASGSIMRVYFDMKNGWKVREEREIADPDSSVHIKATDYFEYRGHNGVKFPAKIVQTTDGQGLTFTVFKLETNTGIDDKNFELRK
jgi:hypothetical protein